MTERMERELVYLDYAANPPADERVLAAFLEAERRCFGNPNAAHAAGLQARACLARAAEQVERGLPRAAVIDQRRPHALLLYLLGRDVPAVTVE